MSTVLGISGGSARAVPPILKKAGLLGADGSPTERYAQFQSDSRRPEAALEALRTGWPEIFRKNRYAHRLERAGTDDLFKEITGLTKDDTTFKAITSTFNVFKDYAKNAGETSGSSGHNDSASATLPRAEETRTEQTVARPFTLSNQINIILPETTDIDVYAAIFKSIRDNLL